MGATYQPLAEVRKNLRVGWYRCPIEHAKLRELSKRSDLQGWFQAGGHLVLFAGTGALVYLFWSQQIWLGFVVALFAHGTVGSFLLDVAPHELGHGTVFRTKWLNKLFLYLYSLLSWWDPFDYGSSHTYHHRYTQYPDADRENLMPLEPAVSFKVLLQLFTVNLLPQPGRIFGKGGLLSTIFVTIKSALGIVGATEIPSREWLQALHDDPTGRATQVDVVVTHTSPLPRIGGSGFDRHRPMGPAASYHFFPVYRELGTLLPRSDAALRSA